MKTAREKGKITQQYIIGQNQFESVNEFTYLGAQINEQNKISEEIRKRIQAGNRCFYAQIDVFMLIKNYYLANF